MQRVLRDTNDREDARKAPSWFEKFVARDPEVLKAILWFMTVEAWMGRTNLDDYSSSPTERGIVKFATRFARLPWEYHQWIDRSSQVCEESRSLLSEHLELFIGLLADTGQLMYLASADALKAPVDQERVTAELESFVAAYEHPKEVLIGGGTPAVAARALLLRQAGRPGSVRDARLRAERLKADAERTLSELR